jgi:hypothetical protein
VTIQERVNEQATKKRRTEARAVTATGLGWVDVDEKKEAFLMPMRAVEHQWGSIIMPNRRHRLLDIWKQFIDDAIMTRLKTTFMDGNNFVGTRKSKGGSTTYDKHLLIDDRKLLQAFAVYIYMVGEGKRAREVRKNGRFKHDQIVETVNHLKSKHPNGDKKLFTGYQSIEVLITRVLLTLDYSDQISKNFRSILDSVGQHAAGDEKLFHFTGNSDLIRLVLSKPGKVGLWFYQLACKLKVGDKELPYMMDILVHHNHDGIVHVIDIVKRWHECIKEVEQKSTIIAIVDGPSAWLVFDSYYTTTKVRDYLIEMGQKFIGSVKSDRFLMETAMIHRLHTADKLGEWRSIYNPHTSEVFTYHYDTKKGVGKKYCISHGLVRTTDKPSVKECSGQIPAYSYYKNMFEVCDNYNRALHDRSWPHPRGGAGTSGDLGCHHDFLMACVLQNIRNAWLVLNATDPLLYPFEDIMKDLAYELYSYSIDL